MTFAHSIRFLVLVLVLAGHHQRDEPAHVGQR